MSTTLWNASGDFFLVKPSQLRLVKSASTSLHDFCLARALSAVTKNCFSEICSRHTTAPVSPRCRRAAATTDCRVDGTHLEALADVERAAEAPLRTQRHLSALAHKTGPTRGVLASYKRPGSAQSPQESAEPVAQVLGSSQLRR